VTILIRTEKAITPYSYIPRQSLIRTWRISRNTRTEPPIGLTRLWVSQAR